MENTNIEFMGYKAMCHCRPIIQRLHNKRDEKVASAEQHIDITRPHETILDCGTLEECYEKIFGDAVKKYNAKQKRKDRRIENYLDLVLSDKRQGKHKNTKADGTRKPAYEMIIQLGNRDNLPDEQEASKVLKDFVQFAINKYPNIIPIGIYLHDDEFSIDEVTKEKIYSPVHIHFDFVYVAHLGKSLKTGMELQSSMSGALREMGFVTSKGGTAQTQFEEAVRHDLQDFAESRGIKIDRTPGEKHSHKEKPVYQQMKENEKEQKRLINQKQEIESAQDRLNKDVKNFNQANTILYEEIQKNSEKGQQLSQKEKEQKAKEVEQNKREENLNEKERDLNHRETMAELRESNNEFQEKKNAISAKQIENQKKDLLQAQKLFDVTKQKVQTYELIRKEVETSNLDIDMEVKKLITKNQTVTFSTRLQNFVTNVKKIVTSVVTELNWYKAAFKDFWNKRSKDFRILADVMDRNHCEKFSDYNQKYYNGQLDYQIKQKKQIDNDLDYDR